MKHPEKKTTPCLQMQEHPEMFADNDIEQMLDDMETLPDVEAEWKRFCHEHPESSPRHPLIRIAAAILITASFSLALYAVATRMGNTEMQPEAERQQTPTTVTTSNTSHEHHHLYDNETLGTILSDMATHYGLTVTYIDIEARDIRLFFRWNETESIEQSLNGLNAFERISIEIRGNELIVK